MLRCLSWCFVLPFLWLVASGCADPTLLETPTDPPTSHSTPTDSFEGLERMTAESRSVVLETTGPRPERARLDEILASAERPADRSDAPPALPADEAEADDRRQPTTPDDGAGDTDADDGSAPATGRRGEAEDATPSGTESDGDRADSSPAPTPSCSASDLDFVWPMPGQDAHEWVINNYVDLDTSDDSKRDYMGNTNNNARTYDNHRGIDIDVPTFRAMDADFPITAAAAGTVVATAEHNFDRNTTCTGSWNFVKVEHDNGFVAYYGHLKQNSVAVEVGDRVTAGEILGVVGSSGCSSAPHLHFEVHDCGGQVVDPFLEDMWINPPVYVTPLGLMDTILTRGGLSSTAQIKDPAPNVGSISPGETLGVGLSVGGGTPGDRMSVRLFRPNGSVADTLNFDFGGFARHSFHRTNITVDNAPGTWIAEVSSNGLVEAQYEFAVTSLADDGGLQQVRHHVHEDSYQQVFDDIVTAGYRPTWIDGYAVGSETYYNAVFTRTDGAGWDAFHGLDGVAYQERVDAVTEAGFRLTHVDSYATADGVRYAGVFVSTAGSDWTAYHGLTAAEAEVEFFALRDAGYHPVVISPVEWDGQIVVTGLWERADVGAYEAWYGMDDTAYQELFTLYTGRGYGLRLAYLNAYTDGAGVARFSAIWSASSYGGYVARHDLSVDGLQAEFEGVTYEAPHYWTRLITGYQDGDVPAFAALFTAE